MDPPQIPSSTRVRKMDVAIKHMDLNKRLGTQMRNLRDMAGALRKMVVAIRDMV